MMKLIPAIIIMIFSLSSCKNQKREASSDKNTFFTVNIDSEINAKDELKLSSFADSLSYIPLETRSNCLISEIKDLRINEKYIFIQTKNTELLVFLRSGKFFSRIGQLGKGPKEYYDIIHFDVANDYVYILDYSKRIVQYTITGEFVKYIALSKQASRILLFGNNKIACYIPDSQFNKTEALYSFLIINQNGDSINSIQSTILRSSSDKISNHFALINFSNQYAFAIKEALNDTLFYLDPDSQEIHGFAFLNLGSHKIDFSKSFEQVLNAPHNIRINKLIDTQSLLFIYYICRCKGNKTTHLSVYDKDANRFFNVVDQNLDEKIINDMDVGPNFTPMCVYDDELVGCINAFEAFERKDFVKYNNMQLAIEDNPIIVISKLR